MSEEWQKETPAAERPQFPKSILAIAGDPVYTDESESMSSNYWIIVLMLLVVVGYGGWATMRMVEHYQLTGDFWGSIDYSSTIFVLFVLWFLISSTLRKYRFRLTDTALEVTYSGLTGTKRHVIPYENIYGVHDHKARLANNVKFRYKWRWYSMLDSRPTMALFYKIPRPGKSPKFGRVMFKPDPQFLLGMNEYMPGRVGISEEETTYNVLLDESARMDAKEKEKAARKAAGKKVE